MHACNHDNAFAVNPIKDPIREPMKKRAPGFSMHYWITGGMHHNILQRELNNCQELIPQPRLLPLGVQKCFVDIGSGRRADENQIQEVRLRIRRTTSSQGRPVGPSWSSSSSLQSNSSRCALVNGTASGVAERLSQTSSRRCNRSSGLRFAMSIVGMGSVYAYGWVAQRSGYFPWVPRACFS